MVERCIIAGRSERIRDLDHHLALKKCEAEVPNYHLVRFDICVWFALLNDVQATDGAYDGNASSMTRRNADAIGADKV